MAETRTDIPGAGLEDNADKDFGDVESIDLNEADLLCHRAVNLVDSNNFAQAITIYEDVIARFPECAQAYFGLAMIHRHLGRLNLATHYINEGLGVYDDFRELQDLQAEIEGELLAQIADGKT